MAPQIASMTTLAVSCPVHQIIPADQSTANRIDAALRGNSEFIVTIQSQPRRYVGELERLVQGGNTFIDGTSKLTVNFGFLHRRLRSVSFSDAPRLQCPSPSRAIAKLPASSLQSANAAFAFGAEEDKCPPAAPTLGGS
jgi:hypothetical protein